MIKLNLKREPYWLDLEHGLRLHVKPLTTAIMGAAQHVVMRQMGELHDTKALPENKDKVAGISESLLIKTIAQMAILEWEGVSMEDKTMVAAVNEQNISDLMDIWFIGQDFAKKYVYSLTLLETEGNSSGLSPSGTSVEGQDTASAVESKNCRAVKAKRTKRRADYVRM